VARRVSVLVSPAPSALVFDPSYTRNWEETGSSVALPGSPTASVNEPASATDWTESSAAAVRTTVSTRKFHYLSGSSVERIMEFTRQESIERLRETVSNGDPVIGAGAGTGISAKFAERGGVDLLIIYNSGRYRMNGRGSLAGLLPYGDANQIVLDMGRQVLPVVEDTPVLAGVNGTDPFRAMDVFIDDLKRRGFSGVQNFPTVGIFNRTRSSVRTSRRRAWATTRRST